MINSSPQRRLLITSVLLACGALGFAACGAPEATDPQAPASSEPGPSLKGPEENLGEASQAILGEGVQCNTQSCFAAAGSPSLLTCCGTSPSAVCRYLEEDDANCGACGHSCGHGTCNLGCCRSTAGVFAQSCASKQSTTDTTIPIVSPGTFNAVTSASYGSTSCSDHFVVNAYGSGSDVWTSVRAFNASLTATTECECKDYELHVKLFGLTPGGQTCKGANGETCTIVDGVCTGPMGGDCQWRSVSEPAAYENRYVAQWRENMCSVSGTITPSQAGLDGEDMQIQAAVVQGSTGNKQPITIRLYD